MSQSDPETVALHAGWRRGAASKAVAALICQAPSRRFDGTVQAERLLASREFSNIGARAIRPAVDLRGPRVAALDDGANAQIGDTHADVNRALDVAAVSRAIRAVAE